MKMLKKVLENNKLIESPYFTIEALKDYIKTDKKSMADVFYFICLKNIGQSIITNLKVGDLK